MILVWCLATDFLTPESVLDSVEVPGEVKTLKGDGSFETIPEVVGLSVQLRQNFVWHPSSSFFAFVVGSFIVVEDLKTRNRRYLRHQSTEITALALSDDGLLLATALAPSISTEICEICLWDVTQVHTQASLKHHLTKIKALLFNLVHVLEYGV